MSNRTRCGALLPAAAVFLAFVSAPLVAWAQGTPFIPYFGKNQIRYDNFRWFIYETDHFEIYYYPEIEQHLERVASYAESAYQHVSGELKYDLAPKVQLILFKTSSEFQQQNVIPGAAQEGVGAFAEPMRGRIVMPLDDPPDLLYRLIVHELTHQFEFDMIPTSLVRRSVPLWVNEGLSDYMTGVWRPIDLMTVRDAAVADIIPKMTELEGYTNVGSVRMIYNLGHAVFEFIESRWGKEGIRQYLFALRKAVIGGGDDAYMEAFRISAEEFDQQFDKYLKDRFKPFRDKERPADYGRNLAPDPEKTRFNGAASIEPSPSGDLIAMVTGNRRDRELDIVLVSSKDGSIIRNLTPGFDQDHGFEFIIQPGMRFNTVPWLSWSPSGDRLAYFVRREKSRTLILQNVLNRDIEQRVDMATVDDPESPDISPDGRRVAFAALQGGVGDIFVLDLQTDQVTNLTKDDFADSGPTWSPDGRSIVYVARISGNEKLFRLDLATGAKTQLTFGTHDDSSAQFLDDDTIVFSSTATDPAQPIDAEVARNGNIYNIWTLSLKTGELRQYTDALGGNTSAVALRDGTANPRIAFVSYYKAEYELHALDRRDPIVTAATSDFGEPGPIIDFQAPLSHTLIAEKKREKGAFEKMFLDGRPPVNVGVTSGGDVFGGSAVTFSDVLGDKQFSLYAASVSQYRTLAFSYLNIARRFNYAVQAYSATQFYYGALENVFYPSEVAGLISRDLAVATRTVRGGSVFGIWPFDRYRRLELFGGVLQYSQSFNDPGLQAFSEQFQQEQFGRRLFQNGTYVPLGVNYVQETTVFREFGPLAGNTMRLSYEVSPGIGDTLSRQTADLDARYYLRLGGTGLLALRARGFKSWGDAPDFMYFGGNSEMRGYEYLEFIGSESAFLNAELRFPFIEAMLTPIGVLGGIRGVLFANMGGGRFEGQPFKWWSNSAESFTPVVDYVVNPFTGIRSEILGTPVRVDGFRLVDARASYGIGLETFALGFPVHFDWAWRTLFNKEWEDLRFAAQGGSAAFRKPRFAMWIGYDF
ncbi:MAG: PD40 domain-containing protein [Acidobacteria bacterium]|nr:PD40 domain-containing protein [Acidobacteriota bacterium]